MKRLPWDLILAFLLGLGGGLLYAWVIASPEIVLTPELLRAEDKDAYREVIAAAYAANSDLERARARLSLLGDADPSQALAAQAQRMLAAGYPFELVQQLVRLASDVQKRPLNTENLPPATPLAVLFTPLSPSPTPSVSPTEPPEAPDSPPPSLTEEAFTIPTLPAFTPRPAMTPVPTVGGFFRMINYETRCDAALPEGLLQVLVNDERGRPLAGVPILLVWDGGQELFYTGLKPEMGDGYADAQLQPQLTYNLQVGGGEPLSHLGIPACPPESGIHYGSVLLTFNRP